jgi:hypothetical protein
LGLSEAGARASVYGTVAGAIVAPLGAIAFAVGAQWPVRMASLIFLAGGVVALMLPPKADSEAPEVVPRIFQLPWRHQREGGGKILSGRLVLSALAGSASLRALYGFLLLSLAFAVKEHALPVPVGDAVALGVLGGALALGTFLSTAIGARMRIRRPVRLQAIGLAATAVFGAWAAFRFTLTSVAFFCLAAAIASGLAKLALDASIQEKIPDTVRASAFAHAETLLMLAWVTGGAIGLTPFLDGQFGLVVVALAIGAAAAWSVRRASRLSAEVLQGRSTPAPIPPPRADGEPVLDPQGA